MCGKCQSRLHICKEVWYWTVVIYWSRFQKKKWYSMEENSPQGICDHIAEKMLLEFAESGCTIFRATTPLSRCKLKSKGHGNCLYILLRIKKQLRLFSPNYFFANQLSLYGAVANVCEEFESFHDRSGNLMY